MDFLNKSFKTVKKLFKNEKRYGNLWSSLKDNNIILMCCVYKSIRI